MQINELSLSGCYLFKPGAFEDSRGRFVKSFVASQLKINGLRTDFVEQYYSTSKAGVIRGMHFQTPPHDHAKLVYCAAGAVTDVILDLRRKSPTFGNTYAINLTASSGHAIYIAAGIAHGFMAVEEGTIMVYNVTSEYAPDYDKGIRWDSFGFEWGIDAPIISERDKNFPKLEEFKSPF
ncbi:dTDP-4-dehydrorhamnose 3,5-epimerase [Comamonas jiangduensis]|uniref:dTDP-4-dehydrorhamnose 3,5-epimerase n=1 Tax=Comamonas jiangduensis TaxID=1194168 RepID=UPI0024E11B86|nr:dTDP-4-dehydrorhamnose 3,5-epimerase [Comamonas jiangduensis]